MRRFWILFLFPALAWGQSTEILRPTVDADAGASLTATIDSNCSSSIYSANAAQPNWYDAGGLSTSSDLHTSNSVTTNSLCSARVFNTWASTLNTYTNLTLNINTLGFCLVGSTCGRGTVAYSLDGGITWASVEFHLGSWSQVTNTITLSPSQNLSNIWVAGVVFAFAKSGSSNGNFTVTGFDVWTNGTYAAPTPTPTPAVPPAPPAVAHPVIISKKR